MDRRPRSTFQSALATISMAIRRPVRTARRRPMRRSSGASRRFAPPVFSPSRPSALSQVTAHVGRPSVSPVPAGLLPVPFRSEPRRAAGRLRRPGLRLGAARCGPLGIRLRSGVVFASSDLARGGVPVPAQVERADVGRFEVSGPSSRMNGRRLSGKSISRSNDRIWARSRSAAVERLGAIAEHCKSCGKVTSSRGRS